MQVEIQDTTPWVKIDEKFLRESLSLDMLIRSSKKKYRQAQIADQKYTQMYQYQIMKQYYNIFFDDDKKHT